MSSRSQRGRRVVAALTMALAVAVGPQTQAQVPTPRPTPAGPVPVERVTIEYTSGTFRVVSRTVFSSVLVPSSELPAESASGFWFELRNSDEGVRYRRGTGNPLFLVFEGAGTGGRIQRSEALAAHRVFSVVVPASEGGDQLVIFSSPLRPGAQHEAAAEIARFILGPVVQ